MAKSKHDQTAERLAKKESTEYNRGQGADVQGGRRVIEVETKATARDGLRQLQGYQKPVYIAGADEKTTQAALEATKGTTVGVMNDKGRIVKPSAGAALDVELDSIARPSRGLYRPIGLNTSYVDGIWCRYLASRPKPSSVRRSGVFTSSGALPMYWRAFSRPVFGRPSRYATAVATVYSLPVWSLKFGGRSVQTTPSSPSSAPQLLILLQIVANCA